MANSLPAECHVDPDTEAESGALLPLTDHGNKTCDLALLSGHLARRKLVGEERYYWDGELPGFGLRVYASGRKRWIVQFRKRRAFRRVTIGKTDDLSAVDPRCCNTGVRIDR